MKQLQKKLRSPAAWHTRRWHVVDFPAWKYEKSERLWAALTKAIYEQSMKDMGFFGRIRFRVRLEWRRLNKWSFFVKGLGIPLVVGIIAAVLFMLPDDILETWAKFAVGGSGVGVALLGSVSRFWGVFGDPFKRSIQAYVDKTTSDENLGFTKEADDDIKELIQLLTKNNDHSLAVFVDDLDRCSPRHVIEIIEAINQIFNSSPDDGQCVFILGMDREVVAASIEVAYKETVEHLKELGNPVGDDYGYFFLSKIVQMSVAIPSPGEEAVKQLLDGFMTPRPQSGAGQLPPPGADDLPDDSDPPTLKEQEKTRQKEEAAQLREASALLASDSEGVRKAAASVLPMLSQNPREIKRFYNAFRLQLLVAYLMLGREVLSPDWLKILARWVALRLHRPRLAEDLDREDWLLDALETYANGNHDQPDTPLANRYKRWFEDEGLRKALNGTSGERLAPYFKEFLNAFARVA